MKQVVKLSKFTNVLLTNSANQIRFQQMNRICCCDHLHPTSTGNYGRRTKPGGNIIFNPNTFCFNIFPAVLSTFHIQSKFVCMNGRRTDKYQVVWLFALQSFMWMAMGSTRCDQKIIGFFIVSLIWRDWMSPMTQTIFLNGFNRLVIEVQFTNVIRL